MQGRKDVFRRIERQYFRDRMSELGLSTVEGMLVRALGQQGETRQEDLVVSMVLDKGAVARAMARLEQLGARQVDSPDAVRPGDTVIIRSHGETRQVLERLEAMGARCVNATCPNVLHIQHIVSRAGQAGRIPLVIGEPHHPEVMGAASWWDGTLVFPGPEELERWLLEDPARRDLPLTAVAQTTCVRSIWESSKKILKKAVYKRGII